MQIVLSAHFDIAKPVPFINLADGTMQGLVDNFAGVFAAWEVHQKTGVPLSLTNFEETGMGGAREVAKQLLAECAAQGGRKVQEGRQNFAGYSIDSTNVRVTRRKGPVDAQPSSAHESQMDGRNEMRAATGGRGEAGPAGPLVIVVDTTRDAGEKPAYIGNVYNFDIGRLQKSHAKDIFFMPGLFEETEDETWVYGHEFGMPTFYFGIPIPHEKDYHDTNNGISLSSIKRSASILSSLITFLQTA